MAVTYPADAAALKRTAARQFSAQVLPSTGFGSLQPSDSLVARIERIWNLKPRSLLSDVKREEIAADARGEDLWLARGGSGE